MNIVVDTSVIIAVIANEPEKRKLIELTRGVDLVAPYSLHWEIGNAFSSMLKRKRISLRVAVNALRVYNQIPITFTNVQLELSLRLVHQLGVYAYDAYFIACALEKNTSLLSLDKTLLHAARKVGINTLET
jgi:predicted nucleic acid-binding protein